MRFFVMFVTAVCVLFLIKLRWPKKKNFYNLLLIRELPRSFASGSLAAAAITHLSVSSWVGGGGVLNKV